MDHGGGGIRTSARELLCPALAYAHTVKIEPDQSRAPGREQFPSPEARGLFFETTVAADEVAEGDIVLVSGRVVEKAVDSDDAERLRLVIVPALAGSPEDNRKIDVVVPRDRVIALARPHEIEQAPPGS
jgi:hypothetical protein